MDKKFFISHLNSCISHVFKGIDDKEDIFEFGIFSNQDISTISFGYNTHNHFSNQLKDYFMRETKIVSIFRWTMPEWYKEIGDENKYVNEINDSLYSVIQPQEVSLNPDNFKENLLDILCNALLVFRDSEDFQSLKSKSILYIEKADSYIDDLMKKRVKMLIGEKLYEEFLFDLRDEI